MMRDVGLRISQARSKRGLTQQALADRIGRSVSSLSGYEHEAQLPPLGDCKRYRHCLERFIGLSRRK